MTAFSVPANLAAASADDPSPARRAWLAGLPAVVTELRQRWELELGAPFQPGGQTSWVAPAADTRGRDLVVKVGWRHPEAAHEAAGLRTWNGNGAILLHDEWSDEHTTGLLLERCMPGTALGDHLPEAGQDIVIAGLLRRLWRQPADGHRFRPLPHMCTAWADQFERDLAGRPGWLDSGLARAGIQLFRSLPTQAGESVLLCTDLHAGNVLAARREPWLVIDPKPYVGDRTFDALQHMLNCSQRLTQDPRGFTRRMAQLLDLDAQRLDLWVFARCVLESINDPGLRNTAQQLAPS